MSSSSTSSGSSPSRAASQLAAVLAQLGRDVLHAQPLVDLLLGRAGVRLAALVVGDAVLAHVQPAPDRLRAQRLVVLARAGEVLQQVAERLLRHHAQVHRHARVGDGPRAGVARGVHHVDLGELLEGLDEGRRVGGGRHHVQVLAVVGHPARAARQLDPRGVRAAGPSTIPSPTRQRLGEQEARAAARRRRPPPAPRSRSPAALAPKPGTSASRPASAASRSSSSESTPSCSCRSARALGPEPRDARDLHQARPGSAPRSLSADGIEPLSSSASIFSAIVLPTPASSSALPVRAPAPPPTRPASRIALAALR